MKKSIYILLFSGMALIWTSCQKDWLGAKPNISLVVPSTINDFQQLLDNTNVFNINQPALGEIGSADFTLTTASWQSLTTNREKNAFLWLPDIYGGETVVNDWSTPYQAVFNANVAMEGLSAIKENTTNASSWNNVQGSALFYRANAFYKLAQVFCKTYSPATASSDLGIPLRLKSDITVKSVRATVQQTYDQIIGDLQAAKNLLPISPLYKTRPSKPAAYALLAKTYLVMGNYKEALLCADSCIKLYPGLIDYNTLNPAATYPFTLFNDEVIYHSLMQSYPIFLQTRLLVDSALYSSYEPNDLRKTLFFKTVTGGYTFKGSYYGNRILFDGIGNDEVYLIRAECYARTGSASAAVDDLNKLLSLRYKKGTFVPYPTSMAADAALQLIIKERRKELIYRGIRWSDLRRINPDSRFAITLSRFFNGQTYTLPANDERYVLPIPDNEIQLSGIPQNPR